MALNTFYAARTNNTFRKPTNKGLIVCVIVVGLKYFGLKNTPVL